ncbi:unnamed protein product [Spirodela intermedia]|uniref:Uncharacterized protein n=1 Tax=Spirodela intermedia TaxID=51605 RepID=A0A7I8IIA4_SPIIN|nr:unnamed protein product [Spirodela intermedia]CAA6657456.1 unnamed protein product [Spirodela intermedia]
MCLRSSPMDATSKSSITSSKNLGIAWENRQHGHDFRSATTSGGKTCLNASGAHHSFLSESSGSSHVSLASVSLEKPIFINDADPPYYRREGLVGQKRSGDLTHPNSKVVKSVDLNLAPPNGFQNRLDPPKESRIALGYSKMISSFCASNPRADQEKETEHSIGYPETFPSILKAEETGSLSSSSKRILGLPAPRWGEISFTSACHQEISSSADAMNRVKEEFIQVSFPRHITKLLDSDKRTHMEPAPEISVAEEINGFRRIINLNSASANMDRLMSPVRSSNDEMLFPPAASVKGTTKRFVFEIDLEAPVTLLSEEQIPSAESASHCSQLGWEATEIEDMHAKAAAEAIQIMSLDKPLPSDRISPASAEALLWLAHVISSNPDDLHKILDSLRDEGDGDPESSDIDGMDYFEYKTLELKETKPRRGPARKRRQKRDFQRDILPGLASLSRHEVTEDLQLMRTSGQLWQPARNQSRCQAKGRMRPRAGGAAAATAVEMPVDPQPGTDVETGVKSILGWGRTTRRGRRQRCSLGNAVVLPQG